MSGVEIVLSGLCAISIFLSIFALSIVMPLDGIVDLHGEWLKAHDRLYLHHIRHSHTTAKLPDIPQEAVEGGRADG